LVKLLEEKRVSQPDNYIRGVHGDDDDVDAGCDNGDDDGNADAGDDGGCHGDVGGSFDDDYGDW